MGWFGRLEHWFLMRFDEEYRAAHHALAWIREEQRRADEKRLERNRRARERRAAKKPITPP